MGGLAVIGNDVPNSTQRLDQPIPPGLIDQDLDEVLLNWGNTASAAASVPEAGSAIPALLMAATCLCLNPAAAGTYDYFGKMGKKR